jgi:hypothetical protein
LPHGIQAVQKLEPNPGPGCHVPLRVPTNSPKARRINNLIAFDTGRSVALTPYVLELYRFRER